MRSNPKRHCPELLKLNRVHQLLPRWDVPVLMLCHACRVLSGRLSEIPQAVRHATLEIGLDLPRRTKFAVNSASDPAPEAGPGLDRSQPAAAASPNIQLVKALMHF